MARKSDLIIHPIRMRIVSELGRHSLTTKQLIEILADIPQATLYRHIKTLFDGGILKIVKEQEVNGSIERTYQLISNQNRLTPEEIADLSPEDHIRYFSIFTAGLIDTFSRYVSHASSENFEADGMSYNQAIIYLSDEERTAFQEQLIAIVEKVMSQPPAPNRKKYTLASVVVPDRRSA